MHELWITNIFNRALAGPANALLSAVNYSAQDPGNPWTDWMDSPILYIASHGYVDPIGKFYVIPSDIGPPLGVRVLKVKPIQS